MKQVKEAAAKLGSRPDAADTLSVLAEQQIRIAKEMRAIVDRLRREWPQAAEDHPDAPEWPHGDEGEHDDTE